MPLYFLCRNHNCLPESHLCDGENDCGDHSDEDPSYCSQIKCNSTTEFQCASGRCVPKSSRCDRIAHCRDRSDERDCLYEPCPKDKFSCANHSQCLDWKEVCDGSIDCKDGKASDELHPDPCPMNVTCPKSTFKCVGTNVCAMPNWMCDGENDCGDNSDENEENCKNFQCPDDWFRCGDNRCIPRNDVCNGVIDCKDRFASDERHPDPCPRNVTCPPDFFSCTETNICAHPHWLCDGADDCGDNSDEDLEMCSKNPCPEDWFRCPYGQRCIPPYWQCDGSNDCSKGEDEQNCDAIILNQDRISNLSDDLIKANSSIPENNTLVSSVDLIDFSRNRSDEERSFDSLRMQQNKLNQASSPITSRIISNHYNPPRHQHHRDQN
ncbi:hypothetical protein NH340_JMT08711 [Sarcoptes scabiei]|nr:hypothetical protein NH340_JMT08711 [Sarcoptes scabiei]